MSKELFVIGFWTTDGMVQPLAVTRIELSKARLRRAVSKFRNDPDFDRPCQLDWRRFFATKSEAISHLPMVTP